MQDQEQYDQQMKLLKSYRNRLITLLEQQAQMGSHTPAHVKIDIQEARDHIRGIKGIIRTWGFEVADNPIDNEASANIPDTKVSSRQRQQSVEQPRVRQLETAPIRAQASQSKQQGKATDERSMRNARITFVSLALAGVLVYVTTLFSDIAVLTGTAIFAVSWFIIAGVLVNVFDRSEGQQ